jgi:hypothetical protein
LSGTLIGTNTCRYTGTSLSNGGYSGNGVYGVDNNQTAYAATQADTSGVPFPGTAYSSAWAAAGVTVILGSNWPQPSSVTVTSSWTVDGSLDVDAGANPLGGTGSGTARYTTSVYLARQNSTAAGGSVSSGSLTTYLGPKTTSVHKTGTKSLTYTTPANATYIDYVQINNSSDSTSTYFANGHAATNFWPGAWTPYQDWKFNLPSGYGLGHC